MKAFIAFLFIVSLFPFSVAGVDIPRKLFPRASDYLLVDNNGKIATFVSLTEAEKACEDFGGVIDIWDLAERLGLRNRIPPRWTDCEGHEVTVLHPSREGHLMCYMQNNISEAYEGFIFKSSTGVMEPWYQQPTYVFISLKAQDKITFHWAHADSNSSRSVAMCKGF